MKKKLLFLLLLLVSSWVVNSQVCNPNSSLQPNQVDPNSDAGQTFVDGYVNVAYSATYSIHVPAEFEVIPGLSLPVNHIKYKGIEGLPPGLVATPSQSDSIWTGGTIGCVLISRTPMQTGVFNLTLNQELSSVTTLPLNNTSYTITIQGGTPSSVNNNIQGGLSINSVILKENLVRVNVLTSENSDVSVAVYSVSGQLIYEEKSNLIVGENELKINVNDIKQGVYIVRVATEKAILTQKVLF